MKELWNAARGQVGRQRHIIVCVQVGGAEAYYGVCVQVGEAEAYYGVCTGGWGGGLQYNMI